MRQSKLQIQARSENIETAVLLRSARTQRNLLESIYLQSLSSVKKKKTPVEHKGDDDTNCNLYFWNGS